MSRLDYFIASCNIISWPQEIEMLPGYKSDHSVIILVLNPTKVERDKGCWKFNTLLLEGNEFKDNMRDKLVATCERTNTLDLEEQWEIINKKAVRLIAQLRKLY